MALAPTTSYFDLKNDPEFTKTLKRSQLSRIGPNSTDLWAYKYAQLWLDSPPQPYPYGTEGIGLRVLNEAEQRVEQVNTWEKWSEESIRASIKDVAYAQIRQATNLQISEDSTREWLASQDLGRYKVLTEALAQTDYAGLDAFDGDLFSYEITEQDYAKNLLQQETKNLAWDSELREAGNGGIFSDAERTDVQARVTANARVSRGLETGVRTPASGAPREWVTMDGEDVENASFFEVTFFWNQDQFIPRAVLDSIPAGVLPEQVFCMVYDKDNVYRSWMPFAQRADGKWETPSDVSYIGIAKPESSNWRVAISYQGTDAESEITSRVVLVPPNSAWSRVRWGGRNGVSEVQGRRRGRRIQ